MYQSLKTILSEWHARNSERKKLQHTYIVAAVVITVIAGLVTLVNPDLGNILVKIAIVSGCTFLINGIAWNLLNSSLLFRLDQEAKPTASRVQRKK